MIDNPIIEAYEGLERAGGRMMDAGGSVMDDDDALADPFGWDNLGNPYEEEA